MSRQVPENGNPALIPREGFLPQPDAAPAEPDEGDEGGNRDDGHADDVETDHPSAPTNVRVTFDLGN